MDILMNLRAFLVTARTGSFSEAARQLHVVPSVIAKRVTHLEWTIGVPLFSRSTRRVALTESGQKFLANAHTLVADFDAIVSGMGRAHDALEGHLRIKAPTSLTVLYLGRMFSEFQRVHDRVTMEVALIDRSVNPLEEGFDIALGGRAALPACASGLRLGGVPRAARHADAPARSRRSRVSGVQPYRNDVDVSHLSRPNERRRAYEAGGKRHVHALGRRLRGKRHRDAFYLRREGSTSFGETGTAVCRVPASGDLAQGAGAAAQSRYSENRRAPRVAERATWPRAAVGARMRTRGARCSGSFSRAVVRPRTRA